MREKGTSINDTLVPGSSYREESLWGPRAGMSMREAALSLWVTEMKLVLSSAKAKSGSTTGV